MNIPFMDLKRQYLSIKEEIDSVLREVMNGSSFILGKYVEEFENDFASYCGAKWCIGVNSGTSAIHLALIACGIKEGDEVITTPFTFVGTVWGICYLRAKPVFVDIDEDTFNINPNLIEKVITEKTKAIIPVHLYGQPADMNPIMDISRKYGLMVIEDACQAHGAEYRCKKVANFGKAGCFSFYPSKNLGAFGEGGAIVTNDTEIANHIKKLRDHAQLIRYIHEEIGFNNRMEGIQGAILRVKLKYLDRWIQKRRQIVSLYSEKLRGLPIKLPKESLYCKHVWHLYVICTKERDRLKDYLNERGINTGIHYLKPLHLQLALSYLGYTKGSFPISERVSSEVLSLPIYPEFKEDEIDLVVKGIKIFFNKV